ncbi:hypothetical protein [Pseudomonas sp. zjy_8]|uniref:hypothetical protein n=1 Tax=Pseudomonas sp. GLN_2 TaxID=3367180 RepID=UPI00370BE99E
MPTENRSSNTKMVSVPRDEVERLIKLLAYQAHPYPSPHAEYWQRILDQPTEERYGEPVWYMIESGLSVMHAKDKALSDFQGWDTSAYRIPLYALYKPEECVRCEGRVKFVSGSCPQCGAF